jgi:hypothetical protein
MDLVPVRAPVVPRTPAPRPSRAAGKAKPAADGAAHPAHATAHAAAHPAVPAGPEDVALLAQQAAFNRMMQLRAELQREANAMRDLAMEQVKRDDQLMNAWIKLI